MNYHRFWHFEPTDNCSVVTLQLMRSLKVRVPRKEVTETLRSHPYHPSLAGIVQSLGKWRIQADAFSTAKENLSTIPPPFIACLGSGQNLFVMVMAIRDGKVEYADPEGGPRRIIRSQDIFMKEWNGVFLMAEADEMSRKSNVFQQAKRDSADRVVRNTAIGLLAVYLLLSVVRTCFWAVNTVPYVMVFLLLHLMGALVSSLLLRFSFGPGSGLTQRFCRVGGRIDCHSVVGSPGARIFDWLTWSEVGMLYFSGSVLYILLGTGRPATAFSPLVWLNALSIPYIAFSLFYQWKVTGKWCPLCLTVQAILVMQLGCCWLGWWRTGLIRVSWDRSLANHLLIAFGVPVLSLFVLKPLMIRSMQVLPLKRQLAKIKMSKPAFSALLAEEEILSEPLAGLGIFLGNQRGKHVLTIIVGANCTLCHRALERTFELSSRTDNLRLHIVFVDAGGSDDTGRGTWDSGHGMDVLFMAIYLFHGEQAVLDAMSKWLSDNKNDPSAYSKCKIPATVWTRASELVKDMRRSCANAGLVVTPTLFFDGRRLPDTYSIPDLRHFL